MVLEYERLKKERRRLLALTGLTPTEFEALHQAFSVVYATKYPEDRTTAGRVRKRQSLDQAPKLRFVLIELIHDTLSFADALEECSGAAGRWNRSRKRPSTRLRATRAAPAEQPSNFAISS